MTDQLGDVAARFSMECAAISSSSSHAQHDDSISFTNTIPWLVDFSTFTNSIQPGHCIFYPRHACAGGVEIIVVSLRVCVCMSVFLSVTLLAATSFVHGSKIRHSWLVNDHFDVRISLKRLCSKRYGVICLP